MDHVIPENTGLFIPTLRSFTNENTFSGSIGSLRFFLYPNPKDKVIIAKIWHGVFCIEKSTVEEEQNFPMTDDGLKELRDYLLSKQA